MEIKNQHELNVLAFSTKSTLRQLKDPVRVKARQLYYEAASKNLDVTGPIYWIYYGMDGNPDTTFTLDIALPVAGGTDYSGEFSIKKLGEFKSLSGWHYGSWNEFGTFYGKLFSEIASKSMIPTGECREIYYLIDFDHEENNQTEVQIGIL